MASPSFVDFESLDSCGMEKLVAGYESMNKDEKRLGCPELGMIALVATACARYEGVGVVEPIDDFLA